MCFQMQFIWLVLVCFCLTVCGGCSGSNDKKGVNRGKDKPVPAKPDPPKSTQQ